MTRSTLRTVKRFSADSIGDGTILFDYETLFGSYWSQLLSDPPAVMHHTELISWEKASESEPPGFTWGEDRRVTSIKYII